MRALQTHRSKSLKAEHEEERERMDVTSHCSGSDITESGANKTNVQSECIFSQPTANGTLPHGNTDGESCDDSMADSSSTNDVSRLLPSQPASSLRKQKGVDSPAPPPPTCAPPSSSPPPAAPPSRPSTPNTHGSGAPLHHQHCTNQKHLSSTRSSATLKTDAAHIKEVAGDDCCVHCLLACLFCELLSMCSAVGECLACGVGGVSCCDAAVGCCCVEAAGEAACTEEACQAVLDCGILEDCCGSSDCLEICLECCSICFPT